MFYLYSLNIRHDTGSKMFIHFTKDWVVKITKVMFYFYSLNLCHYSVGGDLVSETR